MSVCGNQPLFLEQAADSVPIVYTWYPNATSATSLGTAQNLTGYTCRLMVRITPEDSGSPVATFNPTLGGAAGTITISFTHNDTNTLFPLLPYTSANGAYGWYDVVLTSAGGVQTRFIDKSPIFISSGVTRP